MQLMKKGHCGEKKLLTNRNLTKPRIPFKLYSKFGDGAIRSAEIVRVVFSFSRLHRCS
jgi:hypothetical protein